MTGPVSAVNGHCRCAALTASERDCNAFASRPIIPAMTDNLPLSGIRVFDLTLWLVGAWATMQLGALGADVIHVEHPDVTWDELGVRVPPNIRGMPHGFVAWNMNKRQLFLDLKTQEGLAIALELL